MMTLQQLTELKNFYFDTLTSPMLNKTITYLVKPVQTETRKFRAFNRYIFEKSARLLVLRLVFTCSHTKVY